MCILNCWLFIMTRILWRNWIAQDKRYTHSDFWHPPKKGKLNFYEYFLIYFIDYAITVVLFSPFITLHPTHPLPPAFPHFSSCPWVIHISSLVSPFPILFLTSPCLFYDYLFDYCFNFSSCYQFTQAFYFFLIQFWKLVYF